jgi:hypothetical protein
MEPDRVPSRILAPGPVPPARRSALTCDTFWSLMDRWKVPKRRALALIGHRNGDSRSVARGRPHFALSDEQAKLLSCLLEIDLTLTVAGIAEDRLHRKNTSPLMAGDSPLDVLGRCDPRQAATVLWSLNSGSDQRGLRNRGRRYLRRRGERSEKTTTRQNDC